MCGAIVGDAPFVFCFAFGSLMLIFDSFFFLSKAFCLSALSVFIKPEGEHAARSIDVVFGTPFLSMICVCSSTLSNQYDPSAFGGNLLYIVLSVFFGFCEPTGSGGMSKRTIVLFQGLVFRLLTCRIRVAISFRGSLSHISTFSVMHANFPKRQLRSMRDDTAPCKSEESVDKKSNGVTPDGCIDKTKLIDTPLNRWICAMCATSSVRQIYLSYPGVRHRSLLSARLSSCWSFQLAHCSGHSLRFLSYFSVWGTRITLQKNYLWTEGRCLSTNDRTDTRIGTIQSWRKSLLYAKSLLLTQRYLLLSLMHGPVSLWRIPFLFFARGSEPKISITNNATDCYEGNSHKCRLFSSFCSYKRMCRSCLPSDKRHLTYATRAIPFWLCRTCVPHLGVQQSVNTALHEECALQGIPLPLSIDSRRSTVFGLEIRFCEEEIVTRQLEPVSYSRKNTRRSSVWRWIFWWFVPRFSSFGVSSVFPYQISF